MRKIFFLLLFIPLTLIAQKKDSAPLDLEDYILVKRGDTLTINLDELTILPKHDFNSPTDTRYYYWFKRKVFCISCFEKRRQFWYLHTAKIMKKVLIILVNK